MENKTVFSYSPALPKTFAKNLWIILLLAGFIGVYQYHQTDKIDIMLIIFGIGLILTLVVFFIKRWVNQKLIHDTTIMIHENGLFVIGDVYSFQIYLSEVHLLKIENKVKGLSRITVFYFIDDEDVEECKAEIIQLDSDVIDKIAKIVKGFGVKVEINV